MKKSVLCILLAFCLCISSSVGISACAAEPQNETVQPRASLYLSSYGGCTYNGEDDGRIYAEFHVIATGDMDEIGATRIEIQEYYQSSTSDEGGWIPLAVFTPKNAPNLMSSGTDLYGASVSYPRTPGKKYRAKITVYAGKDGEGDSRVYTTAYVVANPIP